MWVRARNSSACQLGKPGAAGFQRGGGEAAECTSQRIRAEDRSRAASSRTSHSGTPCLSAARLNRREAVKSSARGLPASSPITKASSRQRSPSSSANSASSGFSATTWISRWRRSVGSPGRYGRPVNRTVARSWTHSTARSSSHVVSPGAARRHASRASASANPAPAPSRPLARISLCAGSASPGRHRALREASSAAGSHETES